MASLAARKHEFTHQNMVERLAWAKNHKTWTAAERRVLQSEELNLKLGLIIKSLCTLSWWSSCIFTRQQFSWLEVLCFEDQYSTEGTSMVVFSSLAYTLVQQDSELKHKVKLHQCYLKRVEIDDMVYEMNSFCMVPCKRNTCLPLLTRVLRQLFGKSVNACVKFLEFSSEFVK